MQFVHQVYITMIVICCLRLHRMSCNEFLKCDVVAHKKSFEAHRVDEFLSVYLIGLKKYPGITAT